MSQDQLIKLVSTKGHTYFTRKNKKGVERKLEFKKYNPLVRKHTIYKEKKV